jgi:hypothetical protein
MESPYNALADGNLIVPHYLGVFHSFGQAIVFLPKSSESQTKGSLSEIHLTSVEKTVQSVSSIETQVQAIKSQSVIVLVEDSLIEFNTPFIPSVGHVKIGQLLECFDVFLLKFPPLLKYPVAI